jgi:hypothetical protein
LLQPEPEESGDVCARVKAGGQFEKNSDSRRRFSAAAFLSLENENRLNGFL